MKSCFVDTSGFYAFLCGDDPNHKTALELFSRADQESWDLVTTSYIVHESAALIQHRLGWEALDLWLDRILPVCHTETVDEFLHQLGVARWRQSHSRRLSLTDCISFEFMKQRGIEHALVFDGHFLQHGFSLPA